MRVFRFKFARDCVNGTHAYIIIGICIIKPDVVVVVIDVVVVTVAAACTKI